MVTHDAVNDGRRIYANRRGFMISGTGLDITAGSGQFPGVAVTDVAGNVGAPNTFSDYYAVYDLAGNTLWAHSCYSSEIRAGDYAMAGVADVAAIGEHVYFARLDAVGGVLNSSTYSIGAPYGNYVVRELVPDSTGDHVFLVGEVMDTTAWLNYIFAMKIKYDGSLMWSELYDLHPSSSYEDYAYDGADMSFGAGFAVAGRTLDSSGTHSWGYIFVLDTSSGQPAATHPFIPLFTDPVDGAWITAVAYAPNTTSLGGFVAGGHVGGGPGQPAAFWIDRSLNTATGYGNTYATPFTNFDSWTRDIQYRALTATVNQYFMACQTNAGYIGGSDIEVWRLDNGLNATQHTAYGGGGQEDVGAIDAEMGFMGMSLFGSSDNVPLPADDLMITKAYYSGHIPSGCAWASNTPTTGGTIVLDSMWAPYPVGDHFVNDGGWVSPLQPMLVASQCFLKTVPGGSNVRAQAEPGIVEVNGSGLELEVTNATGSPAQLNVRLVDLLGRVCRTETVTLLDGEQAVSMRKAAAGLCAGVYVLQWECAGAAGGRKVMVE